MEMIKTHERFKEALDDATYCVLTEIHPNEHGVFLKLLFSIVRTADNDPAVEMRNVAIEVSDLAIVKAFQVLKPEAIKRCKRIIRDNAQRRAKLKVA